MRTAPAPFGPLARRLTLAASASLLAACQDLPTTTAPPGAGAPVATTATAPPASPGGTPAPGVRPAETAPAPAGPGGWDDPFDAFDTKRWSFADGWANGFPFGCGWRKDHGTWADGQVTLKLTDTPAAGKAYGAGELRTRNRVGYGRITGRLRAASGSGVVTSFITYTGPEEGTVHDEIDFEFLGKNTHKVQLNYFVDGKGGHEKLVELGFDAAAGFHDYVIDWRPEGITWSVDGRVLHQVAAADGPLPKVAGRVMGNVWPAIGADSWAGPFTYPGTPITAAYDRVAYAPL